jgi:hypothetical protein
MGESESWACFDTLTVWIYAEMSKAILGQPLKENDMSDEKRELKAGQVGGHSDGELVVIQSVEAGWVHYKYARASMLKRTTIGSFFEWFTFVNDRWPQVDDVWHLNSHAGRRTVTKVTDTHVYSGDVYCRTIDCFLKSCTFVSAGPQVGEMWYHKGDGSPYAVIEAYSDNSVRMQSFRHNCVIDRSAGALQAYYTRNPPAEADHDSKWHLPSLPSLPPCDRELIPVSTVLPLKQEKPVAIVSATISEPSASLPAALQRAIDSLDADRGRMSRGGAKELQELLRQLREHVSAALDLARCGRIKAGDYGYAIARGWDALGYYQGLLAGGAEAEMLDWVAICTDTAKASVRRGHTQAQPLSSVHRAADIPDGKEPPIEVACDHGWDD